MRGDLRDSWAASLVVASIVGGILSVVSLIANPGGLSSASIATVVLLAFASGLVHRLIFRSATGLGRLCRIADRFPFGVVIYGPDLTIRFANQYAQGVYGKSLPEIVGRRDSDLLSDEAVNVIAGELQDVAQGGDVRSAETRLESGGKRQMFLMTFAPVGDDLDQQREILSIWFETSKIDEMTERLTRLNRTLATLIDANRMLIGCESEQDLRERFCESLCRQGGYELAWIGARNADGGIQPVAAAGCSLDELENLKLRWDSEADHDIPVARALRENQPHTSGKKPFANEQANRMAEKLGLRSCAGLPIHVNDEPAFGLCLCSKRPDAFDLAEMGLLVQLASDAGFAMESVRTREQLAQSRETLAQAQRIAQLGTWEYDLKSGLLRWSDETYRIHGWPHDAPLSISKLEQQIHPDDRPKVQATVNSLLRDAGSVELEYRLLLANNEVRHLYVCGKPVTNELAKVVALTGTVLNITEQKVQEDKKRAFERMLVGFLDNLPAVITLKNEQLEHVYGNSAALDLFHVDPEHFVGSTDTAFLPHDTADILHAAERSALNTRQPVLTPDIPVGSNGEQRHLRGLCFPVVLPGGEVQVGMYATDITELQTATAKTGLLESALEAAANGVVITDTKGNIEWVNSAFTRITGYTAKEAIGKNPRLLKSGKHDAAFYKNMWATLLKGEVWNGEIKNCRKDGTIYDEQMTITPVRDDQGKIAHFIAIKLDITERNELENKFLRSQRMESIGLLAGGVAHDLNNILAPIMMGVELLRTTDLPEAERNEFLDTITQNCERGSGIIRQVLTFARGVEGDRVIVQVRHQVKDIVKMARETFPKDMQISMDVANNFWPVLGDPTQLHQVLLNFSVNARDAMPHGGKIEFIGENVDLSEPHSFQAFEIPPGRYSKLTVRDNGTGMPADVLEHIFEPFYTTKEQGKGTGLGLPTVLGIVKSHGGLVEIKTAPGKGTSAIVWLPAADTLEEGDSKTQSTPPRGHGETLLLVDDEPEIRTMAGAILKKAGYKLEYAEDGAAAVAKFAIHKDVIDLVVTDIMMPVMDGVALAQALRRIDPQARILGSSGFSGDGNRGDRVEDLRRAGVKTLLQKPYTARQLLETVAEELKDEIGAGI